MFKCKDSTYLLLLSAVAVCFFAINAPEDFGDVGLSVYTGTVALKKARAHGGDMLDFFKGDPQGTTFIYHIFGHPLSIVATHIFSKIVGLTTRTVIWLSLIASFAGIITAFYIGKILCDSLFGFLFGFLLAVNVLNNVVVQTGTPYYAFCLPLTLGTFLSFLRLHGNDNPTGRVARQIIFSAFLFALAAFHTYTYATFGFFFSFLFLVSLFIYQKVIGRKQILDAGNGFKFLSIKFYLFFPILIVVFYFGLATAWEKHNHAPLGTVIKNVAKEMGVRNEILPWEERQKKLPWIITKAIEVIFFDIDKNHHFSQWGVHGDTAITGAPALSFFEVLFFIAGIGYCLIRRKPLHLFCLSAIVFAALGMVFSFNAHAPRLYFFAIPIVTLISAVGARECLSLASDKS